MGLERQAHHHSQPPGDEVSPGPRSEERQRAVPTDLRTHGPPGATRGSSVNKTTEPQPTSRSGLTQEQKDLLLPFQFSTQMG